MIHDWKKTKRAIRLKLELQMVTGKRFKKFRELIKELVADSRNKS